MYRIVKYKDIISSRDADTQKRYALIEQLSQGFTVDHPSAKQMDELLTEQLDLETNSAPAAPSPLYTGSSTTIESHTDPKKKASLSAELEKRFIDLFDAIKSQRPQIIRYDLPPTATSPIKKPEIPAFQLIVDDVVMGNNILLIGGAGTGKTYLAEELIARQALGRQHITINCSQWTSPTEIIGGQTMDGYVEGKLIEAWKNGYVLILDELPKIDPNTAGLLNDALAKTKIPNAVIFNSRRENFTKHPLFACIATGNVYPDRESTTYGANNQQDLSLLDRFSGSVYFIEKTPKIERDILQNDMVWSICDKLRSALEELKYEAQLSLRFMLNARDSYNIEMQRQKDKGKNGVTADEGKTFRAALDSFLAPFSELQRKNIKEKIGYDRLLASYRYRDLPSNKNAA